MKKIVFSIVLIIFSIVCGFFVLSEYKVRTIKKDNIKLESKIKKLSDDSNIIKSENIKYEEEINSIKIEKENLLKEKEIWEEMKAKIEKALS